MEFITSKTNQKIKNVINLIKDKKERISQGLFVIEGIKIFQEAVKNKIAMSEIFVTQKFLENNSDIFRFINNQDITVNIITEDISKKISENMTPQSLFVICKMKRPVNLEFVLGKKTDLVMVLNLQDPGNFGTIIRTCLAFGIKNILVSKDCPDIYNAKVLRATMGMVFRANIIKVEDDVSEIKRLQRSGFKVYASSVSQKSETIQNVCFDKSDKNVIIVGNESRGVSHTIIDLCDKIVKIPMQSGIDSLNVAVATGILIWELKSKNKQITVRH